jgi:FAD/FMN-containing dehydrogenase
MIGTLQVTVKMLKWKAIYNLLPPHIMLSRLQDIVGESNATDRDTVLLTYSRDASLIETLKPDFVVRPSTAQQIADILKLANQTRTPVVAAGGRCGMGGACLPQKGGIMLDMTGINHVVITPDNMTVTVGAGCTWGNLLYELKERGFKPGFRGPYSGHSATVGGSVSSNSIGLASAKWGQAPQGVTSLTVVLPEGEILETGSRINPHARPFNRFTCTADLTGLFCGDHSLLGVKYDITLRIYPYPESIAYCAFGFSNIEDATGAFYEIQKLMVAEDMTMVCDKASIKGVIEEMADLFPDIEALFVVVLEEPSEDISAAKQVLCQTIAQKYRGKDLGDMFPKMYWNSKFEMITPLFKYGMWNATCHCLETYRIPEVVADLKATFKKYNIEKKGLFSLICAMPALNNCVSFVGHVYGKENDTESLELIKNMWDEKKRDIWKYGGVPYWTGIAWYPYLEMTPQFRDTLERIKKALDPNCILNPGAFSLVY